MQYRPVVMALTEKDILLFDSVPWSREAWSNPLLTHPILATRSHSLCFLLLYPSILADTQPCCTLRSV